MARIKQQAEALISLIGDDQVTELIQSVQGAIKETTDATKKQGKETKRVSDLTRALNKNWAVVATGVNQALELMSKGANLIKGAFDQMKVAAQEGGVERRFQSLTSQIGGASNAMMALTEASSHAISDQTIQKLSSKALTAGITLKDTTELFTLGTKMASAGLGDQAELTEQLITTFVERSDGMLKGIGIEADFGQTLGVTAMRLNVSSDALNENMKRQVLLKEHLPKLKAEFDKFRTDTAVQQLGQLDAKMENLEARARKFARVKLFTETDPAYAAALDRTKDIMEEIQDLTFTRHKMNIDDLARRKLISKATFADFEKRKIEQQKLRKEMTLNAAIHERVVIMIGDEATAHARRNKHLKTNKERVDAIAKKQMELAKRYGVLDLVLPGLQKNMDAFNKEMGISKTEAEKSAAALDLKAKALENQHKLNKRAVTDTIQNTQSLGDNAAAQARIASELGNANLAAEKWQQAMNAGTLSTDEQREAFIAIEQAMDSKTEADFRQVLLNAQVADSMGNGKRAAELYRSAFSKLPRAFRMASEPLHTFIAMADASTNAMVKTVAVLLELDAAELEMLKKESGDVSGQIAQLEGRIAVAKSRIVGLVQGGPEVRTKVRGGGRAKESDAKKKAKEMAEYERLLKGRAGALLDSMSDDFASLQGRILNAGGDLQKIASDSSFWYDADAHERSFALLEENSAIAVKNANDAVAEIQKRYRKLFKDDEFKKNAKLQEHLREAMATELEIVKDRFEQEEKLREAALENERAYHAARLEAADMAMDIARTMRSEMSQYEMDWAQDQLKLGEGLGLALDATETHLRGFFRIQENLKKAGKDTGEAWGLAAPAMIAGAGQVAASLIENETAKASVLAMVEGAASIAAYARGDFIGGSMHAAAAVAYGTIAGLTAAGVMRKGGAGKASAAKEKVAPKLAEPEVKEEAKRAAVNIVVNFTGSTIVGSDQNRLARDFTAILREANRYGDQTNPEGIGA